MNKDKLSVLKLNEQERQDYNAHQKELHHQASNYQSTYVLGKMEGRDEGIKQVALNLIATTELSEQQIAQATGLTVDEVILLKSSTSGNS